MSTSKNSSWVHWHISTVVVHNVTENSSRNLHSYSSDNHQQQICSVEAVLQTL